MDKKTTIKLVAGICLALALVILLFTIATYPSEERTSMFGLAGVFGVAGIMVGVVGGLTIYIQDRKLKAKQTAEERSQPMVQSIIEPIVNPISVQLPKTAENPNLGNTIG